MAIPNVVNASTEKIAAASMIVTAATSDDLKYDRWAIWTIAMVPLVLAPSYPTVHCGHRLADPNRSSYNLLPGLAETKAMPQARPDPHFASFCRGFVLGRC
jgi:hypothetical protein